MTAIGVSDNALRIKIWTALIPQGTISLPFNKERQIHLVAMLVIKWLHYRSKAGWSFSNMASMIRMNLFTYRDMIEWLNKPNATPPLIPEPEQLRLALR